MNYYTDLPNALRETFEHFIESPNSFSANSFVESCEAHKIDQALFQQLAAQEYRKRSKAERAKYYYAMHRNKKTFGFRNYYPNTISADQSKAPIDQSERD